MSNKGYKAFHPGFYCEHGGNRKRYYENSIAEDTGANGCCKPGVMHYCEMPLDTLDYYPLIDNEGRMTEFAEVEPLDEVFSEGNKRACKKLKIGAKLGLKDLVSAQIGVVFEKAEMAKKNGLKNFIATLAASGDDSTLAASGDDSTLAASGDDSTLAASGQNSKLAASGWNSTLAASGRNSKLAASGGNSTLAASGRNSTLAASGRNSKLAASDRNSTLTASGVNSKLAASGGNSKLAAFGDDSTLAASGDDSTLAASGRNSVAAGIGRNNIAKAAIGSWIVLAEYGAWDGERYPVLCVKAARIDGETLKPGTWYKLENGEFAEVKS